MTKTQWVEVIQWTLWLLFTVTLVIPEMDVHQQSAGLLDPGINTAQYAIEVKKKRYTFL